MVEGKDRGVWMVLFKGLFSGVSLFSLSFSFLLFLISSAGAENTKRFQEKATNVYNAKATRVVDDLNPYAAGPRDPIRWGGLPEVAPGFITRTSLEKHNLVIRITKSGLEEIGNFISDGLKADPSFGNLVNFIFMYSLDKCPNTKVIVDTWDNWEEFQRFLTEQFGQKPKRYLFYQEVATQACGVSPSSPGFSYGEGTTHCFGNDIFFEYIGGYNPTGTWDDTTKTCKDDGKGIFSMCLPMPLLNDEGAPLCVNAIIYGQERNKYIDFSDSSTAIKYFSGGFAWSPFGKCAKDKPDKCPTSQGWINDYFLDRIAGSRLIVDWNRNKVRVFLRQNVGEDHPATWQCEGDMTEHTSDDYLEIGMELQNFEVALTFASPFVDSPIRYVDCNWVSGSCQFKDGVTTFPDELSFCFKNRAAVSDNHICDPQYDRGTTGYRYDPERVISNYINGRAYIRIPIITLKAGIQLKGLFTDWTIYQDWEHTVRALGINLKAIDVSAGVAYDFEPMSASVTTPACWSTSWNQVGSVSYCPEYRVSQKFAKTLLWLDAVVRMIALDTFNTACVPGSGQYSTCIGYFLSPAQVFSFKEFIEGLTVPHPLEEMVYSGPPKYYEHMPNQILIDFGFTNDFWADSAGIIIAANVGVDIKYVPWCSLWIDLPAGMTKRDLEELRRIPVIGLVKDSKLLTVCSFNYNVFTMPTCVQFASFVTAATSQIVPIPECDIPAGAGSCPPLSYRSVDTCTIVNGGSSQYVFKTELLPTAPAPSTLGEGRYAYSITNYYIGIGIHHNLISRVLYEAIGDGLACIWIDKYNGGFLERFLKTDSFGFFIPQLKDRYPGKEMAIEIIPNYKDPGGAYGFGAYPKPASVVAYAKTGGPTFRPVLSVYTQSSTRANFWNEFVQNATYGSSFTMFVQPTTWFDTADLMIDIPYLDLSFNVVTTGSITDPVASQTWMRVFGLTVGVRLSLDLDIVPCVSPDCGKTVEFPGPDTIDFSKPLTSYYRDYYGNPVDPTQGGNYFPEGFTFARVIDLTVYVDPDVRYFIAYNTNALGLSGSDWEGILANILPVILNGVAGAKLRLALDIPSFLQQDIVGRIDKTAAKRIGWALRTLKLPIEFNFPWVGPEFGSSLVWDKPFASEPSKDNVGDYFEIFIHWKGRAYHLASRLSGALLAGLFNCDSDGDGYESIGCGGDDCDDINKNINPKAFDDCDNIDNDCDGIKDEGNCDKTPPPPGCGVGPLEGKVCSCADGDGDGFRNSFCGGNDCNDTDPFINPNMADVCDGIDNDCDGIIDNDFKCLDWLTCELLLQCIYRGTGGPAPKAVNLQSGNGFNNGSENGVRVSRSLTPPETFITYTSDPHALYTKIEFSAWSPDSSKFRYSWRLDGGTWNLWQRENSVVLHHLLEGWHVFEVRAQDENKLIDPTPARYVFRIDSLGPDIRLTAPEMVRGSKFKAFIDVQDAQAQKSETLVSWKLDDGEWSEWVPASELTSIEINSLAKGEHILHIRAKDDVGNISTYSHRFFVSEKPGVLGCSSTAGASFGFLFIVFIFSIIRFYSVVKEK
jgi:hypothetical protein